MQNTIIKEEKQKGIWQFEKYLPEVLPQFRLSLNEGNTPLEECQANIFLKREDLNPTGSLKDRGMAYQISKAWSLGFNQFVLSSSGNAAISAATYCALAKLKLKVFVSVRVNKGKLKKLQDLGVDLTIDQRPLTMASRFAKENTYYNLRPSLNQFGSIGYQTIAFELLIKDEQISDIFIPVSSGVNFLGIYQGFKQANFLPRLHLCQSASICPLAGLYDRDFVPEDSNLASALVAKQSPLKPQIISALDDSKGTGWVVGNDQILAASRFLQEKGIVTSFEGALAYACCQKAKQKEPLKGKAVCLLTGKKY